MDNGKLTIAVPRGAMFKDSLNLLDGLGIDTSEVRENDRRLYFPDLTESISLITMRPSDVLTYVDQGAAHLGITGKDVVKESGNPDVYELLDLGFAPCRMVLASPKDVDLEAISSKRGKLRVATKYTKITLGYFAKKQVKIEIIEVKGSIELAPLTGISDAIVDLTASGATLKENGLIERAEVMKSTARLVANPVAYKVKAVTIDRLVDRIREQVKL